MRLDFWMMACVLGTGHLAAQECASGWIPTFDGSAGVDGDVVAVTTFDAGAGPRTFALGDFRRAGAAEAHNIAAWNGASWAGVGGGLDRPARDAVVFDDGSGTALFVAGEFLTAGTLISPAVAKWDGANWVPMGAALQGTIDALEVFDDGTGSALYAAGNVRLQQGGPFVGIARWDGIEWSAVPMELDGPVIDLQTHDDGTGDALYALGEFASAGGGAVVCRGLARWDGVAWSGIGDGLAFDVFSPFVELGTLASQDVDGASVLLVGGDFSQVAGVAADGLAQWDGAAWSPIGAGLTNVAAYELGLAPDGTGGMTLYLGGRFDSGDGARFGVARLDGSTWSRIATTDHRVLSFATSADGQGVVAGGEFFAVDTTASRGIVGFDGSAWHAFGEGVVADFDGRVLTSTTFDDGTGPALYVGGIFEGFGGVAARNIARWDGRAWRALGSGTTGTVQAMHVFDDGGGPALYVGGAFQSAGGQPGTRGVARWDGAAWSDVDGGLQGILGIGGSGVTDFAVFDPGPGPRLYASGNFTAAGSLAVQDIAGWNGTSWESTGLGGPTGPLNIASALAVFDDGGGPALFASTGGFVGRWRAGSWTYPVLTTGPGQIAVLETLDDGSGPALYIGGTFEPGAGTPRDLFRWDGSSASPVGEAPGDPTGSSGRGIAALAVFDDGTGSGPQLYAAGRFDRAGLEVALGVARFEGGSWRGVEGGGVSQILPSPFQLPSVSALTEFDDGSAFGRTLIVGGDFDLSPGGDRLLARFGGCAGAAALRSIPGCSTIDVSLVAESPWLRIGRPLTLRVNAPAGEAFVLYGSTVREDECGTAIPGFAGELLLDVLQPVVLLGAETVFAGRADFAFSVPDRVDLLDREFAFQSLVSPFGGVPFGAWTNALAATVAP